MTIHDVVDKAGRIRTLFDGWFDSVDVLVLLEGFTSLNAGCWWNSCVGRYS